MNIQKYQVFLKAVTLGSITKAATELNYTQSGVSRMIADLEKEWRVTLVERGKTGISLTSDGMKLLPTIQRICNEQDLLSRQLMHLKNLEAGFIRIGTFSSVATHWLPKMIARFREDYPQIEFELLMGDYLEIEQWVASGRVDFGFIRLPAVNEALTTQVIADDKLLVVMPKDHPLCRYDKVPIGALPKYPFMLLEKGTNKDISKFLEKSGIQVDVFFRTWDDYAIMAMVEQHLGIAILPELILARNPYTIETRELADPGFRSIGLAIRSHEHISVAGKKFLEYLSLI